MLFSLLSIPRSSRSDSPPPDADRARRKALKAAAKREKELESARIVAEMNMYSAQDNPFHDANLGSQFKWHKKREKEKKMGISDEEAARRDQVRRLEAKEELERLNKRRAEREVERELREEEEARMARLAESAQMAEWVAREDDFHLEQSRRRAGIRMRENRAKAIDFLAINLRFADPKGAKREKFGFDDEDDDGWGWEDAGLEWEIDEPWLIFDNLTLEDTGELYQDIRMYLSLEKTPVNIEFWECMQVICRDQIRKMTNERNPERQAQQGQSSTAAVEDDIARLLEGKTFDQLQALEVKVRDKLASKEPIDVDYWEALLRNLQVFQAKSKLHQIHLVVIQNRLEQLRQRQREAALKVQEELMGGRGGLVRDNKTTNGQEAMQEDVQDDGEDEEEEWEPEMSPEPVLPDALSEEDKGLPIVDEADVMRTMVSPSAPCVKIDNSRPPLPLCPYSTPIVAR